MMNGTLDTLKLSEEFTAAGFEQKEARVLAEKLGELANEDLVTKDCLKNELEKLELRLVIKMAVIITAILTFFEIVNKFISQ